MIHCYPIELHIDWRAWPELDRGEEGLSWPGPARLLVVSRHFVIQHVRCEMWGVFIKILFVYFFIYISIISDQSHTFIFLQRFSINHIDMPNVKCENEILLKCLLFSLLYVILIRQSYFSSSIMNRVKREFLNHCPLP